MKKSFEDRLCELAGPPVLKEAKALLKSGRYSVQQVSDMLNFANQSFFGAYFKRSVGCSPSAYRDM